MKDRVHYDVEAGVAAFLKLASAHPLPPGAPASAVIQTRNLETRGALIRFVLEENNRGSTQPEIFAGAAAIAAEWLVNMISPFDEPTQAMVLQTFIEQIERQVAGRILAGLGSNPSVALTPEFGGHA